MTSSSHQGAHHDPPNTVRSLLPTDHVSPATRAALTARLAANDQPYSPTFFTEPEFATLRAICHRLSGGDALSTSIDVAPAIDARLTNDGSDGWRYADLPADRSAFRIALAAIDAESTNRFATRFADLPPDQADILLADVQAMDGPTGRWQGITPAHFFEDLLAEVILNFYAHPLAQEEIGYVGMADLPRWEAIGLNERETREPSLVTGVAHV